MSAPYPALDSFLDEAGTDGYLLDADGSDSDLAYLSGFRAPGHFLTLYADAEVRLLVPDLEYTRAVDESDAEDVTPFSALDYGATVAEYGRAKAKPLVAAAFLAEAGVESISVPVGFPTGTAEVLREQGIEVVPDYDDAVGRVRAVKSDREIEHIAATQAAAEDALAVAEELLARASVDDGVLRLDGAVLTSERVREEIRSHLREAGSEPQECIVASGAEGALGHASGSGPIDAGDPIVVDIAPQDEASGYFGDVTRTFVKDEPDGWTRERYDLTREAHAAALDAIEPGVTGEAVNEVVCDVFEREGYPTLRTDESTSDGFTSSTGHGVGLDLHERPKLSWGGQELQPGHVVTVEPGLYEEGVGGVRLEDLVVVTAEGYENLTDYPRDLRVV